MFARRFAHLATLAVLLCSAIFALGVHHAGTAPLTAAQRTGFVDTCATRLGVPSCTCLLRGLEARGYTTVGALTDLFRRQAAARPGRGPADLRATLAGCASATRPLSR